jgi:acyl transferase domain-containing protein/acyl carrier protein
MGMENQRASRYNGLEIAIVGMSGRFPGAGNVGQFWQNLRDGVESITFLTDEELEAAGVSPDIYQNPAYVKAKGVLEDADLFDAAFFGYSPREAEIIDPQQRVFLECAWEALENAGYTPERYRGLVGVYGGVGMNTYLANIYSNPELVETVGGLQIGIGSDKDYLSTRVSYKLNLEGPSVVVQAACSTSSVAVHLAAQALLNGDCDMALAGGVTVGVPPRAGYLYQEGGTLSPDGHCRAFDARAQGMVVGNGAGVVVLKRLEDALTDGDYISAIIRGSAVNNDGALKVGYGAPRAEAQAKVIRTALRTAEVEPETVGYVEAHGTGTELGDPIEIAALTRAFRAPGGLRHYCRIGSVKTNIGHLDTASGVAGLIKVALALKHGLIPPSLHFNEPNPRIDFADSPFTVNTELTEWRAEGHPRRAGLHSYAIGGTNAHIVLEEAPEAEPPSSSRPWQLLVLSAKTEAALDTLTSNLVAHLRHHPELDLPDVAYTLQLGRRLFGHRRMLVCRDAGEALRALAAPDHAAVFSVAAEATDRPVAFIFPGESAARAGVGAELYGSEQSFREQVDRCAELLAPHIGADLRETLYGAGVAGADAQTLPAWMAEPALFVFEYALAQLWISWGVRPAALAGEGVGELVAACLSGVLTLEEALTLAADRGRPALETQQDEMPEAVVVMESRTIARTPPGGRPAGPYDFAAEPAAPAPKASAERIGGLKPKAPQIPVVSAMTGTWMTDREATDQQYWMRRLRPIDESQESLRELLSEPGTILLEVGAGRTLASRAAQHPERKPEQEILSSLPAPESQLAETAFMLETLGRLYLAGASVDWSGFYAGERRRRVPLPSYPFERQRHWVERKALPAEKEERRHEFVRNPEVAEWFYAPSWKRTVVPSGTEAEGDGAQDACRLVFVGEDALGLRLAERLAGLWPQTVTVTAGEQFAELSPVSFIVNPRLPEDYDALVSRLNALGKTPVEVAHLWSLAPEATPADAEAVAEGFGRAQNLGYFSLLSLAQSLAVRVTDRPVNIQVLSANVQDVTGEESLAPGKATLLDACRAIPRTLPNLTCRSIDVLPAEGGSLREQKLIEHLLAELTSSSADPVVAYRGDSRWVQGFEAVPFGGEGRSRPRLRFSGVYLITGGLGRVGLTIAEYLAQTLQARLILTTLPPFPARDEWAEWLAGHDEADEVSVKIRKLQALEDLGAEVLTFGADVADEAVMREIFAEARRRFGTLNGVVHAAGNAPVSFGPAPEGGEAEYERLVRSKVLGPAVLAKLLDGQKTDFCLLFSSLAAVVSGKGFVPQRAADLYLDAFAHQQNRTSATPWVSINWDTWQFGSGSQAAGALQSFGLTPREGVEVFRRVLSTAAAGQLIVSAVDLRARIERAAEFEALLEAEALRGARRGRTGPASAPDGDEDFNPIEKRIAEVWADVLKVDRVGLYDNFFELGGQSILAIQVIQRINQAFQANLSMRSIFDEATVAGLALLIEEALIERLEAESEPEPDVNAAG